MTETKQNGTSESKLATFVSSAIRAPRAGVYEHLLSQFLAASVVVTDPLKRVKIVCEAALMIPEGEREDLKIDYDRIQELNGVTNAFLTRSMRKSRYGNPRQSLDVQVVSIPWGFELSEENYEKFISSWFKVGFDFWPHLLGRHVETWKVWKCRECGEFLGEIKLPYYKGPELPSKCPRCKEEIDGWYDWKCYEELRVLYEPRWSWFFTASRCMTPEGYDTLKNAFAAWAIPIVQTYLTELTRVVSPGLYSQIIGLYTRRGGSYSQKVKEVAEMSRQDAGNVV